MERTLADKVAWVTGGSRGIGRAIAVHLAGAGAKVVVTGRSERGLGETVGEIAYQGGKAVHLVADVRDAKAMKAAAAHAKATFGGLDIVVANAGLSGTTPLVDGDLSVMEDIVTTNLLGTLYTFRAAASVMDGAGSLVAMSSVLGKFGVPEYGAYCASKSGIQGLVRALAHELGPRKITVNAVCPGWVETDIADLGIARMAESMGKTAADAKAQATSAFPLGRFLDPDEVAWFVVFLAGPSGVAFTGQALSICGGATAFGG